MSDIEQHLFLLYILLLKLSLFSVYVTKCYRCSSELRTKITTIIFYKNYTIAIAVHFITIRKVGENDAAKLPDRQMNNHIDDLCSVLACTIFHYPMGLTHNLSPFLYTE